METRWMEWIQRKGFGYVCSEGILTVIDYQNSEVHDIPLSLVDKWIEAYDAFGILDLSLVA